MVDYNRISADGRVACTELILQMTMMSLSLGHVSNNYGFISTFIGPITTKFRKMANQHPLTLSTTKLDGIHCSYLADDNEFITTRLHDKH